MQDSIITSSPKASLADLFLENIGANFKQLASGQSSLQVDQTFSTILNNTIQKMESISRSSDLGSSSTDRSSVRKSSLEELEDQVEAIGVPTEILSISEDDLGKVEQVMRDSGFDEDQIEDAMDQLSSGPLTMNRVLAVLKSVKNQSESKLELTEESIPLLQQFLQEVGFGAEEIKEMTDKLEAGQKFTAQDLMEMLKAGDSKNLRTTTLQNVDQSNLKSLFDSLGMSDKDQKNFWTMMQQSQGKISLEGMVSFFRSLESKEALSQDQLDNVNQLVKNMLIDSALKPSPYFNRIVSVLQSMGDKELNKDFFQANPAIQALRGGAVAASNASKGTGYFGQQDSGGSGQSQGQAQGDITAEGIRRTEAQSQSKSFDKQLPRALRTALAREVAEKMIYSAKNDQHSLKMQLSPPELGKLNINLVLRKGGLVATVIADSSAVKDALENQLSQLKETLAGQGLELERFDVSTRDQGSSGDANGRNGRGGGGRAGRSIEDAIDASAESDMVQTISRDGYVDRVV